MGSSQNKNDRFVKIAFWYLVLVFAMPVSLRAQTLEPAAPPATPERTTDQIDELNNWLKLIADPNVAAEQRKFVAKKLLQQDDPGVQDALVALFTQPDTSGTRLTLCQAMILNGHPHARFVEPLLVLLSDPDIQLRESAAKALSLYSETAVLDRLIALVQDSTPPRTVRQAAIGALSQIQDGQKAAGILIRLLEVRDGLIDADLYTALAKVSGMELGSDAGAWKQWWEDNKSLSREQWLAFKLERQRQLIEQKDAQITDLSQQLVTALDQVYANTKNGDRAELLKNFLSHRLAGVRVLGLRIVQSNIGEGRLPDEAMGNTLRESLKHPAAEVRTGAVRILGHLRISSDAPLILELLAGEKDESVRLAAIKTLGNLSNPDAVPFLMDLLERPEGPVAFREAAAKAIGMLGPVIRSDSAMLDRVAEHIQTTFENSADQPSLRSAVISAMSSLGNPRFKNVFLAYLHHDQPEVRQRCAAGLRQLNDPAVLEHLIPLIVDPNINVRWEVLSALEQMGGQESHLVALANRLSPETEPDTALRETARQCFVKIWNLQNQDVQITWATKLQSDPNCQIELLKSLDEKLASREPVAPELIEVRKLLAGQLYAQSRFLESAKYWHDLAEMLRKTPNADPVEADVNQVRALLRAQEDDSVIRIVAESFDRDDPSLQSRIRDEIVTYLTEQQTAQKSDRITTLAKVLRARLPRLFENSGFSSQIDALQPQS